jgi:hypothetical protein
MKLPSPQRLGLPQRFAEWRLTQERAILSLLDSEHRFDGVNAPTGCHAAGTLILRYDGTQAPVESVAVGDQLMGPDGLPRTVIRLHRGRDEMARITPIQGEPFVVNLGHVLALYKTRQGTRRPWQAACRTTIRVRDYLTTSEWYRHLHKLERSICIERFARPDEKLPIDPYFLGVLLGDGSVGGLSTPSVCTPDPEIVSEVYTQARKWGLAVRVEQKANNKATSYYLHGARGTINPLKTALRAIGCAESCDAKHIPDVYRLAGADVRWQLLAGLLDTDGYLGSNCFEIIMKSARLRDDVVFLARSLGLAVSISTKTAPKICDTVYHRLAISGDTDKIPTRIARKQATSRRQIKSHLVTGFSVDVLPVGDFYGFELDGDHLYLTADFTIHHNSGKSALAVGLAQLLPETDRVLILTSTKALQAQVADQFHETGLRDVQGKSNYKCVAGSRGGDHADTNAESWVSVDHGPCFTSGVQCQLALGGCSYFDATKAARRARIVSSSYAKWISTPDPDKEFGKFDWLICDEAGDAEQWLTDSLRVDLRRYEVESLLHVAWPSRDPGMGSTRISDWREWAHHTRAISEGALRTGEAALKDAVSSGRATGEIVGRVGRLREINSAITTLRTMRGDWVLDDLRVYDRVIGVVFDPVWPAPYAESLLWRGIPRVVLMGATLVEKHMDILGVPRTDRSFTSYPSMFAVARRPIVFVKFEPALKMSYQSEKDESVRRRVVEFGDRLIADRLDRKGLIHTVSYARRDWIVSRSVHRELMVTHAKSSESTRAAVTRFKEMPAPAVLISPSVSTGWDFPMCDAEWGWVPKLPFENRDSALVQARIAIDPVYLDFRMANTLTQMVGRLMRSSGDSSQMVVTDSQFGWHPWRHKALYSQHILESIRVTTELPHPLPKLRC